MSDSSSSSSTAGLKRNSLHQDLGLPCGNGKRQKTAHAEYPAFVRRCCEAYGRAEEERRLRLLLVRRHQKLRRERPARREVRRQLNAANLQHQSSRRTAESTHEAFVQAVVAEKDEERREAVKDAQESARKIFLEQEQHWRDLAEGKDAELASQRLAHQSEALHELQQQHDAALLRKVEEMSRLRSEHEDRLDALRAKMEEALVEQRRAADAELAHKSIELRAAIESAEKERLRAEEAVRQKVAQAEEVEQLKAQAIEYQDAAESCRASLESTNQWQIHEIDRLTADLVTANQRALDHQQALGRQIERSGVMFEELRGKMERQNTTIQILQRGIEAFSEDKLGWEALLREKDEVIAQAQAAKKQNNNIGGPHGTTMQDLQMENKRVQRRLEVAEHDLARERANRQPERPEADYVYSEWQREIGLRQQRERTEATNASQMDENSREIIRLTDEVSGLKALNAKLQKDASRLWTNEIDNDLADSFGRSELGGNE